MVLGRGLQHPTSGAGVPPRCCPVAGAGVLQSTGLLGSRWGWKGPGTLSGLVTHHSGKRDAQQPSQLRGNG